MVPSSLPARSGRDGEELGTLGGSEIPAAEVQDARAVHRLLSRHNTTYRQWGRFILKSDPRGRHEAYPATNKKTVAVWFGTVAMFEAEGFGKVATLGRTNLVMRLTL